MPPARTLIFFIVFPAIALLSGLVASQAPSVLLLAGMGALVIFIITFLNTEIGLYILILSMLLSPEIGAGTITGGGGSGRGVAIRLDDLLLVIIGFSWFAKSAVHKDLGLFRKTPLNRPIAYYIAVCVFSTTLGVLLGNADPKTGFFFVLKYFEYFIVFFMVANHLETEEQVKRFITFLFITCFITAIIGVFQIPMNTRYPPNVLGSPTSPSKGALTLFPSGI